MGHVRTGQLGHTPREGSGRENVGDVEEGKRGDKEEKRGNSDSVSQETAEQLGGRIPS